MGKLIRLPDDIEEWLQTIHKNSNKALRIVKTGFTAHEDLKKQHTDILLQLKELRDEMR